MSTEMFQFENFKFQKFGGLESDLFTSMVVNEREFVLLENVSL